jgi:hypothetical protein
MGWQEEREKLYEKQLKSAYTRLAVASEEMRRAENEVLGLREALLNLRRLIADTEPPEKEGD